MSSAAVAAAARGEAGSGRPAVSAAGRGCCGRGGAGVAVPGPLGALPGAPRSEGRRGPGGGETAEVGASPHGRRALWGPGSEEAGGEGRARGAIGRPPGPGPETGTPRAAAGARAAGPPLARAAPAAAPTSSSNGRLPSGLPPGCRGRRPPRPRSWGEGAVPAGLAGSRVFGGDVRAASPLPAPPARCQSPGASGPWRWEGRPGASSLLVASGFVPLARPPAPELAPSRLAPWRALRWRRGPPTGTRPPRELGPGRPGCWGEAAGGGAQARQCPSVTSGSGPSRDPPAPPLQHSACGARTDADLGARCVGGYQRSLGGVNFSP